MTSPRETPDDSQKSGRVALEPRVSDAVGPVGGSPLFLGRVQDRTGAIAFGVMGGLVGAYLVWLVLHGPPPPQSGWINGWALDVFYLVAVVLCVTGGLRRRPGSYVPLVFGLALLFTMLGNTTLTVYALHGIPPPPPTIADVFGLGFIVLCFIGIGLMAREDRERLNPRDLLDGGIAALGAGAVGAAFVLAQLPHRQGQSTLGSAVVLAYPIGFVVLVIIVVGAATISGRRSRGAWVALAAAFALVAVPSAVSATTAPSSPVGFSILNLVAWPTAILILAASMWLDPGATEPVPVSKGTVIWIPAAACAAALAVLLAATVSRIDHAASALAAAALVLVILRGYGELRHEIAARARTEQGLRASDARYRQVAEEQASLRRVATLVAQGVAAVEVFSAVARETKRILDFDTATLLRLEADGMLTVVGSVATLPVLTAVGDRRAPLAGGVVDCVVRTGLPARVDGFEGDPGSPGDELNSFGYGGAAAAPVFVEGRLWGVLRVAWSKERSVSVSSEDRLQQFSELIATALANADAREELRRVAEEQAALRRVATLVAKGATASAVFAAVAEEVGQLLSVDAAAVRRYLADGTAEIVASWSPGAKFIPVRLRAQPAPGTLTAIVRETGRPGRVDKYTEEAGVTAREMGIRSSLGVPITVEGEIWGLIAIVSASEEPPPAGTENRLAGFTELVATAIANTQARDELRTMADEQAALRRVAILVAQGATSEVVFTAVAEEVGRVAGVDFISIGRYHPDGGETIVGAWSRSGAPPHFPIGTRLPADGRNLHTQVFRTLKPARLDVIVDNLGPALAPALAAGIRAAVGVPIEVEGQLWGVIISSSTREEPLPPETEIRMAGFTQLVATAVANAQARIELRRHADEQAALRRVATLVAQGRPPEDVFAAVTEEVGRALGADLTGMSRYNGDGTATVLGEWTNTDSPPPMEIGEHFDLGGENVTTLVALTGLPARVDDYDDAPSGTWADAARIWGFGSCVGAPIIVEGQPWGVVSVASLGTEILPENTEARLTGFTEMVATAIMNAKTRQQLHTIAEEKAALGRVATLVAEGEAPAVVFAAVAEQVGRLLNTDDALVARFESDDSVTIVASWTAMGEPLPVGHRRHVKPGDGVTPLVRETGRSARIDSQSRYYAELGVESAVAAPITVEGRIWGVVGVALRGPNRAPPDTEERLAAFTDLVATAIANAESRAEIIASRARIVAAADGARRQIERDLHDGAQQRLVSLVLQLREARATMPQQVAAQLDTFAAGLDGTLNELLELARGIHPTILTKGGLGPALNALAHRSAVPVEVTVRIAGRLPERIEVAAYFVVSEALTNATKHAHASAISVDANADADVLRIAVCDDGKGGADFTHGTGLVGLKDRVEALGGKILLESKTGKGTALRAELPISAPTDSITSR